MRVVFEIVRERSGNGAALGSAQDAATHALPQVTEHARGKCKLIVMRAVTTRFLFCLGLLSASSAVALPARPAPAPVPAVEFSVATLRLPQADEPAWAQRREQMVQVLEALRPDVISVQEVQQQGRRNAACWLAQRLRYSCDFITADPPSQPERHGSAMLSRLAVSEDGVTLLHPPGRYSAAGMIRIAVGATEINVYTARLRPEGAGPTARQHQTNDLMAWIAATAEGHPSVIAGDFAAPTDELVRSTPGFQPARRNPSARIERTPGLPASSGGSGHGMDVLFQVKTFSGLRQKRIELAAEGPLPSLALGTLAVLRLQEPVAADTAAPEG